MTDEERGFDDAELEEIMDEIESLEGQVGPEDESPKDDLEAAIDDNDDDSHEEEVCEGEEDSNIIAKAPEAKKVPIKEQNAQIVDFPAAHHKNQSSGKNKMALQISGDLEVELDFHVSGEVVNLSFDGAEGLVISLSSGAQFKVPLKTQAKSKAA